MASAPWEPSPRTPEFSDRASVRTGDDGSSVDTTSPFGSQVPIPRGGNTQRKINALFRRATHKDLRRQSSDVVGAARRAAGLGGHARSDSLTTSSKLGGRASTLAAFEAGPFSLEGDLGGLTEKGLDSVRAELAALDAEAVEELRRVVHAHYRSFITASQGVGGLEAGMSELRNLLANSASFVAALKEVAAPPPAVLLAERDAPGAPCGADADADDASPEALRWEELLDDVDIALAERRPSDALHALHRAEAAASGHASPGPVLPHEYSHDGQTEAHRVSLEARRSALAVLAEAALTEADAAGIGSSGGGSGCSGEVHVAVRVLAAAAGPAHAAQRLLAARAQRLRRAQAALLKPQNTGGADAEGTEYAGALAQATFCAVGDAADDMAAVFGDEAPELSSILVCWALQETQRCGALLRAHAIAPFAAAAGVGATVQCCVLALANARALQHSHGLALGPRLLHDLWPAVEQVVQRRLRRAGEEVARLAGAEVDGIASQGLPKVYTQGWSRLVAAFPSADRLLDDLQAMVTALTPLAGPRVAAALRLAANTLLGAFVDALTDGFARHRVAEGKLPVNLCMAVEPALGTARSLVDQFLPEAVAPLASACGAVCDGDFLAAELGRLAEGCAVVRREGNTAALPPPAMLETC